MFPPSSFLKSFKPRFFLDTLFNCAGALISPLTTPPIFVPPGWGDDFGFSDEAEKTVKQKTKTTDEAGGVSMTQMIHGTGISTYMKTIKKINQM